jgi:hypothetical protein
MEDFISFILGIASEEFIRPVYSIVPADPMEERIATGLKGYRNNAPVRIGNAAVGQVQHDTYGSIILAAMPMFFDRRLPRPGDAEPIAAGPAHRGRMGVHAVAAAVIPDTRVGLEGKPRRLDTQRFQQIEQPGAIAEHLGMKERAAYWTDIASRMQTSLVEQAWNEKRGAFTASIGTVKLSAAAIIRSPLGATSTILNRSSNHELESRSR